MCHSNRQQSLDYRKKKDGLWTGRTRPRLRGQWSKGGPTQEPEPPHKSHSYYLLKVSLKN